jgi:hypothetical protein
MDGKSKEVKTKLDLSENIFSILSSFLTIKLILSKKAVILQLLKPTVRLI